MVVDYNADNPGPLFTTYKAGEGYVEEDVGEQKTAVRIDADSSENEDIE